MREDVDAAGRKRGEAVPQPRRRRLVLRGVAQDGGRDGAAEIDVEPSGHAFVVERGEARSIGRHAAAEHPARLDVGKRRGRGGREHQGRRHHGGGKTARHSIEHVFLPFSIIPTGTVGPSGPVAPPYAAGAVPSNSSSTSAKRLFSSGSPTDTRSQSASP